MNVVPFEICKIPVKIGLKGKRPKEFAKCRIVLHLNALNSAFSIDAIKYKINDEEEMIVGLGSTHFSCAIDICVLSMIEGEISRFIITGPPKFDNKKDRNQSKDSMQTKLKSGSYASRNILAGEGAMVENLSTGDNVTDQIAAVSGGDCLSTNDADAIADDTFTESESRIPKGSNIVLENLVTSVEGMIEDKDAIECCMVNVSHPTKEANSYSTHNSSEQMLGTTAVSPCGLPATFNDHLDIEITLVSTTLATDVHCLDVDELLERASILKDIGVTCFKQYDLTAAFHKFGRALKYLVCVDAEEEPSEEAAELSNDEGTVENFNNGETETKSLSAETIVKLDDGEISENGAEAAKISKRLEHLCQKTRETARLRNLDARDRLLCQCYLNLAACQMQASSFERACQNCSRALDFEPENVKGLFRRAQALRELDEVDSAAQDLKKALELEPDNRTVAKSYREVKEVMRARDQKVSLTMKKMFQ